ncbi:DUF1667 domain-containing protein [Hydrogenoanaerobacterium sp.]|uniref:DUF1667 domain-containing protein n=1 Tax=Hydrogenoanaerobacterium sp. TaxID=2953763 RepID=UPI00289CB8FD|nr:DUF1667 domain-containing protein [Hydrogenoanaerobacterium sp.]
MKMELTCIGCPKGCRISAEVIDGEILSITGWECKIGEKYAREELTLPTRMVTSLVKVNGRELPLSVKTARPIDKSRVFDSLQEIAQVRMTPPVYIGDVIVPNVCSTGVDVIATKEIW